jgi:hypothetical protein
MKIVFFAFSLLFSLANVYAQSGSAVGQATLAKGSTALTLSPFATATELMKSATFTAVSPFASTSASLQARGVAGKEQLKDELVVLNEEMLSGEVKRIQDVRQSGLRELFSEIAASDEQMAEIDAVIKSGSKLHRIATAVAVELMDK